MKYMQNDHYTPLVITNQPPPLPPKKSQKNIIKTSADKFKHNKQSATHLNKQKADINPRQQWNTGGNQVGLFDNSIKKGQLAQQQRVYRAQSRKSANSQTKFKTKYESAREREQQMGSKAKHALSNQKQQEIKRIKQIVEMEKKQKQKNDKIYEDKKKQLQKERQQLIKIQMDIAKNGPKSIKHIQKIINQPTKHKEQFQPPTQSQLITNSRSAIRQKQIEQILRDRDKLTKKVPSLGYHPTLIPLLSRASYKIISTHVSTLVELLLDDLLIEEVLHLDQVQAKQRQIHQQARTKQVINDYQQQLAEFVDQVQQIEGKIGNYHAMKFEDIYKPKMSYQSYQPKFTYEQNQKTLYLDFDSDKIEELHARSDRFKRFVQSLDDYKKSNLEMFKKCTEELIEKAVEGLAEELDNGSKDFVELIFRNQFK